MAQKGFLAAMLAAVRSVLGRGNADAPQEEMDTYFEPLEVAFDGIEIGTTLDWHALDKVDRDFLEALMERNGPKAKEALKAGARADMDCGHGCNTLMLAAAIGDIELVAKVKEAGVEETPEAAPYLEVLEFSERAKAPQFLDALAEIERITGQRPRTAKVPGAFQFTLTSKAAKKFLDEHHERLKDWGCYAFVYDRLLDKRKEQYVIWVLPTMNQFAVMACTGVSGLNYDIDNYLVLLWMKRLYQDYPYSITDCSGHISGHFRERLDDVEAMAKRMYAFCPDIVDQGTNTVEALARELKETNALFFWWD